MDGIDFSDATTQQLHRVLVDAYYKEDLMIELLERAGVRQSDIPFKSTLRATWQAVLVAADKALTLNAVLEAVLGDNGAATVHSEINTFRAGYISLPAPQPAPSSSRPSNATERRAFEKIMGDQPTFLDIAFLQAGLDAAWAVARLRIKFSRGWYLGTGFLIGRDLILTNHHNLFDENGERFSELEIQFDYETTMTRAMREAVPVAPDLTSIVAERDGDWGVVRLAAPVIGRAPLKLASACDAWVALRHTGGDMPLPGTKTTVYRNEASRSSK